MSSQGPRGPAGRRWRARARDLAPVAVLLLVLVSNHGAANLSGDRFERKATLPLGTAVAGSAWDPGEPSGPCRQGCLYLFGGRGDTAPVDAVQRYEVATGATRTMAARLPVPRALLSAAYVDGLFYVFGGWNPTQGSTNEVLVYDSFEDRFTTDPQRLPEARHYMGTAVIGTKVYLFGGVSSTSPRDSVWVFDASTDRFTTASSRFPRPLYDAAAFVQNGRIYLAGGHGESGPANSLYEYDPANDELADLGTTLPSGRGGIAAAVESEYAFLMGGHDGTSPLSQVLRVRTQPFTVEAVTGVRLPSARTGASAVWTGREILVLGGIDAGSASLRDVLSIGTAQPATTSTSPTSVTTSARASDPPGGLGIPDDPVLRLLGVFLMGALVAGAALGVLFLVRRRGPAAPVLSRRMTDAASGLALRVSGLSVEKAGAPIVSDVSLQVEVGTLALLLGRSGSGKSTLLKAIVGLEPAKGSIQILGPEALRDTRRGIGYVPQELQLYEDLSAIDNVVYFGRQYGIPRGELRKRGLALLGELGLQGLESSPLSSLSGGQRRRVSIATALVHGPRLLVLDEPTSGLDFSSRKALWEILQHLSRARGVAVLASTHFIEDGQYATVVGIVQRGHLARFGRPQQLIRSLPGDGRCVDVELEDLSSADRKRLEALTPALQRRALIARAEHRAFSVRYLAHDPRAALRLVPEELHKANIPVRSARLAELTLEDVFLEATGEPATQVRP